MFKALPTGTQIPGDSRQLISMQMSLNQQPMAVGGGPMRPTRAYILGTFTESGTYRAFVYFGLMDVPVESPPQGMLFSHDPMNIDLDTFEEAKFEALEMVQQQGFDMERVEFRGLQPAQQRELLQRLPIAAPPARPPNPQTRPTVVNQAPPPPVREPAHSLPPIGSGSGAFGSGLGVGQRVEISQQISLPRAQAIDAFGRILAMF